MLFIILGCVMVCVSGLVYGATLLIRGENTQVEDRLQALTKNRGRGGPADEKPSLLNSALDEAPGVIEQITSKFLNLKALLHQTGWSMSPTKFVAICFRASKWN